MKILFVTDLYPIKDDEKVTPKTLYSFVKEWQKAGHDVSVLKPNFLLNSFLRKKPFYKIGQYGDVFNVNYITPFLFNVNKKLPKLDYDFVVAHMPSGIIFSNHLSGKLICAVHSSDIEVLTNPLYGFYFKPQMELAYKRACGIACRSQVLREKFLKLYPQYEEKTFLCESGINFEPVLSQKTSRKTIVTCANLIKRKNIDKLILAVNELPEMNLKVIGEGKELKYLKSIAKKNVEFVGRKQNSEVLDIMKHSDIFILPSENETFGMVYLEAMACGCLTVGVFGDGIDGIIKDNYNGFLTKPSVNEIKNVIEKISKTDENTVKYILQNCYNTVNSYKSADCAEKYLNNILKII